MWSSVRLRTQYGVEPNETQRGGTDYSGRARETVDTGTGKSSRGEARATGLAEWRVLFQWSDMNFVILNWEMNSEKLILLEGPQDNLRTAELFAVHSKSHVRADPA